MRREVDCDTFYCTWRDCVKSFNRRDSLGKFFQYPKLSPFLSLVRHLRVHVNVRPFKCERCGTVSYLRLWIRLTKRPSLSYDPIIYAFICYAIRVSSPLHVLSVASHLAAKTCAIGT